MQFPPWGRLMEILRGKVGGRGGGVQKQKNVKEGMKLNQNFQGVGGGGGFSKTKELLWEGYFLEHYMTCS